MNIEVKPGAKFRSSVCTTEVVVVRGPKEPVDLRCGGEPLIPAGTSAPEGLTVKPPFDTGTLLGKRYVAEDLGIEVLCVKAGQGALSNGDEGLTLRSAKPLPSSD